MYQRVGKAAFKKDLTNINALLKQLDNPHKQLRCIHVAGTNGKGSTSHYIASMLQHAGYRVALYTSPHLTDFRERIRVNGAMITEEAVLRFVNDHIQLIHTIKPSFFEISVAMAFWYFDQSQVDFAVIETGLGGRLDSTNVVNPLLSIITNISLDHTQMLGQTRIEIAREKAGIIKPNVPVVIGEHQKETDRIFIEQSKSVQSDIYFAQDTNITSIPFIRNGLKGVYQTSNLQTAIVALHVLASQGHLELTTLNIKQGAEQVVTTTGIHGRWETLQDDPRVIADVAHNVSGLTTVISTLSEMEFETLHIVLGVVNDKELDKILILFPNSAKYYFCKPNVPRGLDETLLQQEAYGFQLMGDAYDSVSLAYQAALKKAKSNDLIYIGGSTFVVAEII